MKIQDIITENQQFTKVNTSPDNAWQMLGGKHPVQFAVEVLCPSRSVVSTIKNKIGTAYVIERDDSIAGNGIGIAIISPRFEGGRSAQDAYEKILDIIEQSGGQFNQSTQTTVYRQKQDVAKGSLNEFAPGGSEGNGPFEYGTAIIQIGEDFVDTYSDEGVDADARAIIKVGNTFMSAGMKAGIQAFYAMDTQVRDHVAEQLMDQGFNVRQDIYEPYDQQFTAAEAARGIETILALLKEFAKTVEEPEDRKTVAGIYKAFQQGMEPGFVALRNAFEFDIDADFYDFARDRGIDLDQVAARAGFDTDSLLEVKKPVSEGVLTDIRYAWVRILTGLADKAISLANSGELNAKQRDAIAHGTKELEQKLLAKISGHPREQQLRPNVDYIVKQVGQQTNFSDFSKTLYQMAKQFKPELGKFSEGVMEGTDPTEQAMDQSISDLVKDAMGTRPNNDWMQRWMAMSVDKKLALYQQLASQLD